MLEAATMLGKKEVKAINRFNLLVRSRALLIGFSVLFLAAGILLLFLADDAFGSWMGAAIAVLFGLGFLPFCMLVNHIRTLVSTRSLKAGSAESECEFRMDEELLSIRDVKPDIVSIFDVKWRFVSRGYETKEYFFLCIGKAQVFIIPKSGITRGSAGETTELLRKVLGKRFASFAAGAKKRKAA